MISTAPIIAACACAAAVASQSSEDYLRPKSPISQRKYLDRLPEFTIKVMKQYSFEQVKVILPSDNLQELSEDLRFHAISIPSMEFAITRTFKMIPHTGLSEFMNKNLDRFCAFLDTRDEEVIDEYFSKVYSEFGVGRNYISTPNYTTQYFWTAGVGENITKYEPKGKVV